MEIRIRTEYERVEWKGIPMYIIIGGAGMVGGELASRLLINKHDVVVIDQDKQKCDRIYADTGIIAIHGCVSQMDILEEAGIRKADVIVAATVNDADNLACAILARSLEVPRVIVRLRNPTYENAYRLAGVETIVRVTDLMVNQLVMEIENPEVKRITSICEGKADIFKVIIPQDAKVTGQTVREITKHRQFPSECVFMTVYNPETKEFRIPRGDRMLNPGDEVVLVAATENTRAAVDFLTSTNKRSRLLQFAPTN